MAVGACAARLCSVEVMDKRSSRFVIISSLFFAFRLTEVPGANAVASRSDGMLFLDNSFYLLMVFRVTAFFSGIFFILRSFNAMKSIFS
jgi:hypothetical protein